VNNDASGDAVQFETSTGYLKYFACSIQLPGKEKVKNEKHNKTKKRKREKNT
jgi:hypothetical protein